MGENLCHLCIWHPESVKNSKKKRKTNIPFERWTWNPNKGISKEKTKEAKNYITESSLSLAMKEMQIKTILTSHLSQSNSKEQQNNQQHPRLGVGNRAPSLSAGRTAHQCSSVGISVDNSQRLKINPQYDPAMPLLGIYPKNSNSCSTNNVQSCSLLPYSQS